MSETNIDYTERLKPLLIVISGPSGVGKDSVIARLRERNLPLHFVITATTRPQRENEQHGRDYFFVSQAEYDEMLEKGELLEHATVYGQGYGIPKQQVREALASGKDVILRVDVQGAATIRKICPEVLDIFLTTPNEQELVERLIARDTETREAFELRMATAKDEFKRMDEFDYFVINRKDHLNEAVDKIVAILQAEHQRVHPRKVTLK